MIASVRSRIIIAIGIRINDIVAMYRTIGNCRGDRNLRLPHPQATANAIFNGAQSNNPADIPSIPNSDTLMKYQPIRKLSITINIIEETSQ